MRIAILLFGTSLCASAQLLSVGVRGGIPLTNFFDVVSGQSRTFSEATQRWIVGPTASVNLPFGFSIQGDALYRRLEADYTPSSSTTNFNAKLSSWQFPIQAKWALLPGPIRPFISGGPTFQRLSDIDLVPAVTNPGSISDDTNIGFTFGIGLQLRFGGRFRIEPEFRYTRWGVDSIGDQISSIAQLTRNQGDFLVGIIF